MNLYYKIWVDGIVSLRSRPQNAGLWKFSSMTFMSMAMALNIMVVMAILQRNILHRNFYELKIDIFYGTKLEMFVSFFILFLFPPLLINYLFIFRQNRYKRLIKKYKDRNGKLFIRYFLSSLVLPFVLLFLGYLWEQIK
jgi:hypothetical protein